MIRGNSLSSSPVGAIDFYVRMLLCGVEPNSYTFPFLLKSCAKVGATQEGKQIHGHVLKLGLDSLRDAVSFTALITGYTLRGCLDDARRLFEEIPVRDAVSWNAMIAGYAQSGRFEEALADLFEGICEKDIISWNVMIGGLAMHGHANMALELFRQMRDEGFEPDDITFVGVLSACSHAGLVELGRQCFSSMVEDYDISPKLQHYGCMIDLLGRAGLFDEAEALMKNMEMKPDGAIWGSLLGACRVHGNVELGEFAAKHLFELEPENPGAYVLLSNIYATAGRWDDVARIRTKLNDKGMKKVPGCSSIEVDSVVHEFLVGDKKMKETGLMPNISITQQCEI
ncbi:unnamed protein product, partial [Vitis vinifera]